MSAKWHELRDHLLLSSSTFRFQRDFEAMRRDRALLARFGDPAALLARLHHGPRDPESCNRILASLVEAAREMTPAGDCALNLLLLALWPGLDAVRRRAIWRRIGSPDEIAADLLAQTTGTIRDLDLGRVTRIAATILRNVERDLLRAHRRERAGAAMFCDADPDEVDVDHARSTSVRPDGLLRGDLHRLLGLDADLVLRVAVDGVLQGEVGSEFGLSAPAAAKRYQRAIRRLREAHEDFV